MGVRDGGQRWGVSEAEERWKIDRKKENVFVRERNREVVGG